MRRNEPSEIHQPHVSATKLMKIVLSIMMLFCSFGSLSFAIMQIQQNMNGRKIQMNSQRMPRHQWSQSRGRESDGFRFKYNRGPRPRTGPNGSRLARERRRQSVVDIFGEVHGRIINDANHLNAVWWNSAGLRSKFPEYRNQPNVAIIGTSAGWANKLETQNYVIAQKYRQHNRLSGHNTSMYIPQSGIHSKMTKRGCRGGKDSNARRAKERAAVFQTTKMNATKLNVHAVPFQPRARRKVKSLGLNELNSGSAINPIISEEEDDDDDSDERIVYDYRKHHGDDESIGT